MSNSPTCSEDSGPTDETWTFTSTQLAPHSSRLGRPSKPPDDVLDPPESIIHRFQVNTLNTKRSTYI